MFARDPKRNGDRVNDPWLFRVICSREMNVHLLSIWRFCDWILISKALGYKEMKRYPGHNLVDL